MSKTTKVDNIDDNFSINLVDNLLTVKFYYNKDWK